MKLLFDENLSPDLAKTLATAFPFSAHVRELGLLGADDTAVWQYAGEHGFLLVTKDDDFVELSILRGAPPKVVLLGLGNCKTVEVAALLERERSRLHQFCGDTTASLLELP